MMSEEDRLRHEYIGDGVYAEFDGYGIWLRTGNHEDNHLCTNKIYMEPDVFYSLNKFVERLRLTKGKNVMK